MNHQKTLFAKWLLPLLFFFLLINLSKANAIILNASVGDDANNSNTTINKAWSKPVALANTALDYISNTTVYERPIDQPKIIVNENGKAFSVWAQYDSVIDYEPGNTYMKYTYWSAYFDGKNWSNPIKIKGINPSESTTIPEIIFDENGNVLAAWSESTEAQAPYSNASFQDIILTSHFDTLNLDWDNPIQLQYGNGQGVGDLKIIFRNDEKINLVWMNGQGLWSSVFNGSSWSNPSQDEASGDVSLFDLTFNKNNSDIVHLYQDVPDENPGTIAVFSTYFNGNNWNAPQRLSNDTTWIGYRTKTAFLNNGNAITVWEDTNIDGVTHISANHFNRNSRSWESPVLIAEGGRLRAPEIVANNNGHAVVVWINGDTLWANYFNGSNWSTASPIESTPSNGGYLWSGQGGTFKVAIDDNNHAHVVWVKSIDGNLNVWANSFDGNNWGVAKPIESTEKEVNLRSRLKNVRESGPVYLNIAIDDSGNAHALWERSVLISERELQSTTFERTKTKTIWTSQLKTIRPIIINEAIVYTAYHAVILTGSGFTDVIDERTYKQVKLVDQSGNTPFRLYRWRDNLIVAIFRELPKSVTITIPNQTKIIPFLAEYPR